MHKKQRITLFLDSMEVEAWVYSIVEWIQSLAGAQIDLILLREPEASAHVPDGGRINLEEFVYLIHNKLDEIIFPTGHNAFAKRDIRMLVPGVETLQATPIRTGSTSAFSKELSRKLAEHEPDIILDLSVGPLSGDILGASKLGVWSYFHGDIRTNRGVTPGYLEVVEGIPGIQLGLALLGNDQDGGTAICSTWMGTRALSITRSNNKYYWKTAVLFQRKIRESCESGQGRLVEKMHEPNTDLKRLDQDRRDIPSNLPALKLAFHHSMRILKRTYQRLATLDQWFLLYSLGGSLAISLDKFKRIVPPKDRLWADPFVIFRGGKYYIFLEEFLYSRGKGHISVIEMDENGNHTRPRQVLVRDHHLSYPFVFSCENKLYMIPESAQNKTIELYECVNFPYEWKHKMNLMQGITAVDTTLFRYNEKWWLFTAIDDTGEEMYDELSLFSAPSPFNADWKAHPLNPIVSDSRSARPAGRIFVQNDKIFRPSQDCAGFYGRGININEIKVLDESNYVECPTSRISPEQDKEIKGIHTIAFDRGLTVLDGFMFRNRLVS